MGEQSIFNGNIVELHYWFDDDSHTMDANVFTKASQEFLGIAKEFSQKFGVELTIEICPLKEGGLISWFKFNTKQHPFLTAFLIYTITEVLYTPLTTTLQELTKQGIEYITTDSELRELENEKKKVDLKLDIAQKRLELEKLSKKLDENKIQKKRSNFYETLDACPKIEHLSVSILSKDNQEQISNKTINKANFKDFILSTDEIEPDVDEHAIIDIISPVLKKGKYKWTGIYNNSPIIFSMLSSEFKTLVQTGQIEFRNGSRIDCRLIINRAITEEGETVIKGYCVELVHKYFLGDIFVETNEGKVNRNKKEADSRQLNLFDDI